MGVIIIKYYLRKIPEKKYASNFIVKEILLEREVACKGILQQFSIIQSWGAQRTEIKRKKGQNQSSRCQDNQIFNAWYGSSSTNTSGPTFSIMQLTSVFHYTLRAWPCLSNSMLPVCNAFFLGGGDQEKKEVSNPVFDDSNNITVTFLEFCLRLYKDSPQPHYAPGCTSWAVLTMT